jgi:hypothetical protein
MKVPNSIPYKFNKADVIGIDGPLAGMTLMKMRASVTKLKDRPANVVLLRLIIICPSVEELGHLRYATATA